MIKVDKNNYQQNGPNGLVDLLLDNKGVIIEKSVEGLVELFKYIISAIGERRKRWSRVDTLEAAMKAQLELNEKLKSEIEYLKSKV